MITYTTTDAQGHPYVTSTTSYGPPETTSVVLYTTTDAQGSTYVTSSTSTFPVSPSTTVIAITTTDSHGSTYVTSTTSNFPATSPSTSVIVFATTDSHGSTYTTSTTSTAPMTSPSVVLVTNTNTIITTDSGGSTFTTIQTQTSSSTVTASAVPTVSAGTCNAAGNTGVIYADSDGTQYKVYCGTDFPGSDLPAVHVNSLADCAKACSEYVPSQDVAGGASCVAAAYGAGNPGSNCYLKYTITTINYGDGGFDSLEKVGYTPPAPPTSKSLVPPNGGSATGSGSGSAGGSTSTPYSGGTTNPSQTTSPYPPASIISGTTNTHVPNPTADAYPCPDYDQKDYIDSAGTAHHIECGTNYPGNDLTTPHEDTFEDCVAACDNYVPSPSVAGGKPCIGASWGQGNVGGNCYLKYAIGQRTFGDSNFDSFSNVDDAGSISSGGPTTGSTSTSTDDAGATATSTDDGGAAATSTGVDNGGSGATSTDNGSGVSTTTTTSPTSTPMSQTTTSANPATTPASSTTTSTSSSTTSATASSTDNGSGSGTNTAEPSVATAFCPQNNNTQYTDVFGNAYHVKCGLQIDGDNAYPAHADTFAKCLEYCDILEGCAAVTYQDGASAQNSNCYPYSTFRFYSTHGPDGVFSGVPVSGQKSSGAGFNDALCPSKNQSTFMDYFGNTYNIGCDQNIDGGGTSGGQDLLATVASSLEGCLTYCSTYDTCVGADWTGTVTNGNQANCYPKFGVGTVVYQAGTSWGALQK